jgi:hypothetical protein
VRKHFRFIQIYSWAPSNVGFTSDGLVSFVTSDIAWKQTYVSPTLKCAGRRKGRSTSDIDLLQVSLSLSYRSTIVYRLYITCTLHVYYSGSILTMKELQVTLWQGLLACVAGSMGK